MRGRPVCITGVGAVSAAGHGVDGLRALVCAGATRVSPSPALAGLPVGRAPDRPPSAAARRLDRSGAFFLAAAHEAWDRANLHTASLDRTRCALIEGSSLGPMADLLEAHRDRLQEDGGLPRPSGLIRFMAGSGGAAFAQAHGFHGAVMHVSGGCVSSTCAIIEAIEQIASDRADVVVAGGAECPLQTDIVDMFRAARLLADTDSGGCKPFDAHRSGTVLGEGGAALVLEAAEHARNRGAAPIASICGCGVNCEDYSMTAPHPDGSGVAVAIRQALSDTPPEAVGWIKTHGAGTKLNDAAECRGLASVFGRRLSEIPITALKPMTGHCIGASGAVESVAALLALEEGVVPPTIGTQEVDETLPACNVVTRLEPNSARTMLMLTASFGGRYGAITVRLDDAVRSNRRERRLSCGDTAGS